MRSEVAGVKGIVKNIPKCFSLPKRGGLCPPHLCLGGATDPLPLPYSTAYGLSTTHRIPNEYDSTIGNQGYVHTQPGEFSTG